MKPRFGSIALDDLFKRIETDFAPMAREKNLRFVVMPTSLKVVSDANLLRRLVQNLVSNAIKYTIEGKVLVGARRRGDRVVIEVLDSGIGIPSSKFRTVFKEFARLDDGARTASGLGLGLSIVDRLSRMLSHPVRLASTPGRGTAFRVDIPRELSASHAAAAQTRRPRQRPVDALSGLRVLCIDNEPKILEGMVLLTTGWGCAVSEARSMHELSGILERREPAPDVVIADYHLGDGNGIEAILGVRAHYQSDIPALLITADRTAEVRAEAEHHGIGVQHKPVKPAAIRAYLTQAAGLRRVAAE
jgi:CheY-like chemotaxis protein